MRKLFTLTALLLAVLMVYAQTPSKFSYQAVIRNSNNQLVTNHAVGMRVSILQSSASGSAVYTETQTPTTNSNGLITIEIGGGTEFSTINWMNGPYFIKTETDPDGGVNYSITGVSQLLSVPYALHAKTAEIATNILISGNETVFNGWDKNSSDDFSGNYNDLSNKPTLFDGTWTNLSGKPTTISGFGITDAVTTASNQTITGSKTFTGTTTVQTPVNGTDAATKAYVDNLERRIEDLEAKLGIRVKDIEGNAYSIVTIGTQIWMGENLRTTKLNDGTAIPKVTDHSAWSNLSSSAYCWYNNDSVNHAQIYGAMYNWYVVSTDKLCPAGWHTATEADWASLETFLGGNSIAGSKLKEAGTAHWSPNTDATNESGFTAQPGGQHCPIMGGYYGGFLYKGEHGCWWVNKENDATTAYAKNMSSYYTGVYYNSNYPKTMGMSVRCIKN